MDIAELSTEFAPEKGCSDFDSVGKVDAFDAMGAAIDMEEPNEDGK